MLRKRGHMKRGYHPLLRPINLIGPVIASLVIITGLSSATVLADATVSQGYSSSKPLAIGTVVSTKASGNELEETNLDNELRIVGVVVSSNGSVIDVQPSGSDIRVATSGDVELLVSDVTGNIKAGDNLVISPLAGVASRDTTDAKSKKYLAVANQDFSGSSPGAKQITISYNDGSSHEVDVGIIKAKMNLSDRPNDANVKKDNFFVALISKIIGKQVNGRQLLAATAVFVTTFIVTGLMLQGSIRGSFVALGRNPLSKSMIVSNLFKIVAIGLLVLEIGAAAAYVILAI